jgi:hypothetical protein
MLVPSAIVAWLCTVAFHLSALTLRTCIFDPVMATADRGGGYAGPWHIRCSACYVHGFVRIIRLVGHVNGKRNMSFCVPWIHEDRGHVRGTSTLPPDEWGCLITQDYKWRDGPN